MTTLFRRPLPIVKAPDAPTAIVEIDPVRERERCLRRLTIMRAVADKKRMELARRMQGSEDGIKEAEEARVAAVEEAQEEVHLSKRVESFAEEESSRHELRMREIEAMRRMVNLTEKWGTVGQRNLALRELYAKRDAMADNTAGARHADVLGDTKNKDRGAQ